MPHETRELPTTGDEPGLPPPGTYALDPAHCIAEFTVRVLGTRIRCRLTPTDGELTVDDVPRRSTMLVRIGPAPAQWTGPLPLRHLLARRWARDGDVVRLEAGKLRPDRGRFRLHGTVHFRGRALPAVLTLRVVDQGDSELLMVVTATAYRDTAGTDGSSVRRLLPRRRFRLLFAAEFRR